MAVHTHIHTYIHTYRKYMHACIGIHVHTYIHIYIYMHNYRIYTYRDRCSIPPRPESLNSEAT